MSLPPFPSTTSLPSPPKKVSLPLPPMSVSLPAWPWTRVGLAVVNAPLRVSRRIRSLPPPASTSILAKEPSVNTRSADPLSPMSTWSRFGWLRLRRSAMRSADGVPEISSVPLVIDALTVVAAATGAAAIAWRIRASAAAAMSAVSERRTS